MYVVFCLVRCVPLILALDLLTPNSHTQSTLCFRVRILTLSILQLSSGACTQSSPMVIPSGNTRNQGSCRNFVVTSLATHSVIDVKRPATLVRSSWIRQLFPVSKSSQLPEADFRTPRRCSTPSGQSSRVGTQKQNMIPCVYPSCRYHFTRAHLRKLLLLNFS